MRHFVSIIAISICIVIMSCSSKETAASVAQKWCDLNGKVYRAEESNKNDARRALEEYEIKMRTKYNTDEVFMKEVNREIEKCEDASEGRR
jgi:hypothetical protein